MHNNWIHHAIFEFDLLSEIYKNIIIIYNLVQNNFKFVWRVEIHKSNFLVEKVLFLVLKLSLTFILWLSPFDETFLLKR